MTRGTRYRIVTDAYMGYTVQVWCWWCPFWRNYGAMFTHSTVEKARVYARRGRFVEYVDIDEDVRQ